MSGESSEENEVSTETIEKVKRKVGRPRKNSESKSDSAPNDVPPNRPINKPKSDVSGKSWARAGEIETILTNYIVGIGSVVSFANQVDGETLVSNGPKLVHELVELAKTDRQYRQYLEWLAAPGKYAPLTGAIIGVAFPIMANHGLLPNFGALLNRRATMKDEVSPDTEAAPAFDVSEGGISE